MAFSFARLERYAQREGISLRDAGRRFQRKSARLQRERRRQARAEREAEQCARGAWWRAGQYE